MKMFYDANKMEIISLESVRRIYASPDGISMKNIIIEYTDGYELKLRFDSCADAAMRLNKFSKILSGDS